MADIHYFFKDTLTGVYLVDGNALSKGNYILEVFNTTATIAIVCKLDKKILLGPTELGNLRKENNTSYSSIQDILESNADFFIPKDYTPPVINDALFWLRGNIIYTGGSYYFKDYSGNNRNFLITDYDFDDGAFGFPYKSAATTSAPVGDAVLIAADVNNYLYAVGGTPNAIPVVSLFQDVDYANKLFCKHVAQVVDGNGVETKEPFVKDIVLYNNVKTGADLIECQSFYGVPVEVTVNAKWVDRVNGNDTTGNGTKALPYLTYAKALTVITTGGTIYIKTGIVTEICVITNISLSVIGTGFTKNTNATRAYSITSTGAEVISIKGQILAGTHSIRGYGITGTLNVLNCKLTGTSNSIYGAVASSGSIVVKNSFLLTPMSITISLITMDTNYVKPISGIAIRSYYNLTSKNNKYDTTTSATTIVQRQVGTTLMSFLGDTLIGNVFTDEAIATVCTISLDYCKHYQTASAAYLSVVNTTNVITFNINYCHFIQTGASILTCISLRGANTVMNNNIFDEACRITLRANSDAKTLSFANNIAIGSIPQFITITDYTSNIYNNILINETSSRINCTSVSYVCPVQIYNNYMVSKVSKSPFVYIGTEYSVAINGRLNGSKVYNNRFKGPLNYGNDPGAMHGLFVWNQTVEWYNNNLSGSFLGFVAKSNGGTYDNRFHHNIVNNCSMSYTVKGLKGTKIYNNLSYNAGFYNGLAEVNPGYEGDSGDSIVKNNIAYESDENSILITIEDNDQLTGCDFDNNVYYNTASTDIAEIVNTAYTLAEWQALGYDGNSLFQNPDLDENLIPSTPIGIGEDLGASYDDGLDISTNWGDDDDTIPVVVIKQQSETWQVGAYVL